MVPEGNNMLQLNAQSSTVHLTLLQQAVNTLNWKEITLHCIRET